MTNPNPLSAESRKILNRERGRITRRQGRLGEAVHIAAQIGHVEMDANAERRAAFSRGVIRNVTAVLASENVNVPISCQPSGGKGMQAWTDFKSIYVYYPEVADKRQQSAILRSLLYHEGGHVRFTVPFPQLHKWAPSVLGDAFHAYQPAWNALEDQRMETAVVTDSPVKAKYLTALIMEHFTPTLDAAANNWPLLIWRRYLPKNVRAHARRMFVVKHGEGVARQFETVVSQYVLASDAETMLQAVAAFKALQERIHTSFKELDSHRQSYTRWNEKETTYDPDALSIPVDQAMQDEDDDIEEVDNAPTATSSDDLSPLEWLHLIEVLIAAFNAPETLVRVQYVSNDPQEAKQDENPTPQPPQADDADDADDADQGAPQSEPSGKPEQGEAEAAAEGNSDEAGTESDTDEAGTESGAHAPTEQEMRDELQEALQEAHDDRYSDRALDGDERAINEAMGNHDSHLEPYTYSEQGGPELTVAGNVSAELEQSFRMATMDRQPAWVEQQPRGIVNPIRYETRQPGDREFFRQWTEDDQPGFNLAVSIMLDYSGSMAGEMLQLSQAAYASKQACDNLGIPCTVTLWDNDATVLFDARERCSDRLPILKEAGGTDPSKALMDLDNQRIEKAKHLVIIMTDGSWGDNWMADTDQARRRSRYSSTPDRHLSGWATDGRSILALGLNQGDSFGPKLRDMGANEAHDISDLMEIPRYLEQALIDLA